MKKYFLGLALTMVFVYTFTFEALSADSERAFQGTWIRLKTFTNGQLVHEEPATMILTGNTFRAFNRFGENSGSLKAEADKIVFITEKTDFPAPPGVGKETIYQCVINQEGNQMTLVNTQFGAEVKEIYKRKE